MSVLAFVPFAVRQRRRGLVRDPAVNGYSLLEQQWVPEGTTVADRKKKTQMKKVDRVIAVLSRFVAYCARTRQFRKVFPHSDECWANIAEREDNERIAENKARMRNLVVMRECDLRAHFRLQVAEAGQCIPDSLIRFMGTVWALRDKRDAQIAEGRQVWKELNFANIGLSVRDHPVLPQTFRVGSTVIQPISGWVPMSFHTIGVPVRLHNTQSAAPVRRVTGRFSALDSDDE